jgi:hypothetical protein
MGISQELSAASDTYAPQYSFCLSRTGPAINDHYSTGYILPSLKKIGCYFSQPVSHRQHTRPADGFFSLF